MREANISVVVDGSWTRGPLAYTNTRVYEITPLVYYYPAVEKTYYF
jgi:hypothetical protein